MDHSPLSGSADLSVGRLRPPSEQDCARLAEAIVALPPWSQMGYSAEAMTRFLAARDDGARRYVIDVDGAPAGAVSIRYPWLLGPYVELLAILPASQGRGLGAAVLDWLAQEASRLEARNLWVCASRGNASALRFYQRHGFEETAALPDLVADGFEDILLRRTLFHSFS